MKLISTLKNYVLNSFCVKICEIYNKGESFYMEKETILVIGAGTMGASIAQVFSANGYRTYMSCRHAEHLNDAVARIDKAIDGLIAEGMAKEEYRKAVHANLICLTVDKIPEIASKIDVAVETIAESPKAKKDLYQMLNDNCREDCIFCSNTSGMDVFSVSKGVIKHQENLIITHWFNPPHLMKLVEVVRGTLTSDATTEKMCALLKTVGKKPAVLNHFAPGFIVNRLATVIMRELYYMIGQGWISAEDADNALRYTNGLRWGFEGPVALWDFVGLDIPMTVAKGGVLASLCNDTDTLPYGEKLLAEGKKGVKTGEGALKWGNADVYVAKRNRRIIQMSKIMDEWDKEDA